MITTLPRTTVRAWLTAGRIPLGLAERLFGGGAEDWPPTLAYEGFEAGVKQFVGSIFRDEDLVREGDLERAKVERLRQAASLEAEAELRQQAADEALDERRSRDRQRRQEATESAQRRKSRIAQEASEAKDEVEEQADAVEQAIDEAEAARKQAADKRARQTRRRTIEAEEAAVTKAKAATSRRRAAQSADERRERVAAARTNGR
ncbi:MAG: hypothetical protein JO291_11275 [Acidimicrobiia bacterium]|nr:hypothetical protein [Acidimicrobiia bacterium]